MGRIENIIINYVQIIDVLLEYRTKNNDVIYFENVDRHSRVKLNFKPKSFKKVLTRIVGKDREREHLEIFKNLGFILIDMDRERYTQAQKIKGRTVRTISIFEHTYQALKELIE
ncbi:hypothetical protein JYT99_03185 [bacterium AH-315-E09]|nr:hypothetical protein [bacterium AH-315-E09]